MSRFRSPVVAAIASAALTATVVGGVAIAQTSSSVITACVAETSGNVRIVSDVSDCKPNETSQTWNQQGPQGPQGPQGTTGAQGPAGTARAWGKWVQNSLLSGTPGVSVEHRDTGDYCVKVEGLNLWHDSGIVATLSAGYAGFGYRIGWNVGGGPCAHLYGAIDVHVYDSAGAPANASFFFVVP